MVAASNPLVEPKVHEDVAQVVEAAAEPWVRSYLIESRWASIVSEAFPVSLHEAPSTGLVKLLTRGP